MAEQFREGYVVGKEVAGIQANLRNVADELQRINALLTNFDNRLKVLEEKSKEK